MIKLYIPETLQTPEHLPLLKERLINFFNKLHGRSRDWCVNAYMEYVMSWELYGTIYFSVSVTIGCFLCQLVCGKNRFRENVLPCDWNARYFYSRPGVQGMS